MNGLHNPDAGKPAIAVSLTEWLAGLDGSTIPDTALIAARRALVDVGGVMYAGIDMPLAKLVREEAVTESAMGPASIPGTALRLPAAIAARVNATTAHVLDFDANFNRGMVFGPAILFPALLALAETEGVDGATLLQAFAIGTEVCRTLAESLSPRPYVKSSDSLFYLGWFNTAVLGPIGVAAAASWMLKLDSTKTRNALTIAAVQAGGLRIGVGSDMKPLLAGRASETGLRAALLARKGASAPADAFEGHRGFIQVINHGKWTPEAFETLGSFEDAGPSLKLYPACSSVQAAAEALDDLLATHQLSADDVETIICEVTPHIASNLAFDDPTNVTEAQFSISYALGCILAEGNFSYQQLTAEHICSEPIRAQMQKVRMENTLRFDNDEDARTFPEATRVILKTVDGRSFEQQLDASTGKPVSPMSDDLLERKFLSNTTPRLGAERARALFERLSHIDRIIDLTTLSVSEGGA